ncbi:hypothetical protein INS49_005862 [Diaporthe citri]|uniref:uncharacterized protein n=1 Tax=Diaporthe citri TaxID=83186 RepID=UPI001C7FB73C|nr:uncharacterized protein INS49_005862 [Diaporthe citri]KAG6364263.1 hypothetical protein INS49_005862 [Diaporthe citri]
MAPEADPHTVAPRDDYIFSRDFLDINRMNLLHSLWVKIFGYVIHPKIPKDGQDLRVADIGTGTGIWLLDARDSISPSARLDGFDISLDGVPPADTLPSNVKFRHWDLKEDLPEDLVGVFDIVHLRSLSFVLLNDQVPAAVERIVKMLKPGGYIQWGEPDFESIRTDKTSPEIKTEGLSELHELFSIQDPRAKPTWLAGLPATLSAAGFVQVEVDKSDPPPHMAFVLHECGLIMYEIFRRKTQNEKVRQQLGRILPLAVEETRQGAYTTAVRWTVIARKPVSEA